MCIPSFSGCLRLTLARVLAPTAVGICAFAVAGPLAFAAGNKVHVGLGAYATAPHHGWFESDQVPPTAKYRSGPAAHEAAPTSQWYSSVMFTRHPYPIYAQPMVYRPIARGFELGLPNRHAFSLNGIVHEVGYPFSAAIRIVPLAVHSDAARLHRFSDWLAQFSWQGKQGESFTATVLHGSPFSYYHCSTGNVEFELQGLPIMLADPRKEGSDPLVVAFAVGGHSYAIFAPTGAHWKWLAAGRLELILPSAHRYFSVAGLPPDAGPKVIEAFHRVAYAFPVKTRAHFHYDEARSIVTTTFRVTTVAMQGNDRTTFMGLYPHQWDAMTRLPSVLYQYNSVRGPIRIIKGNFFKTKLTYHGLVPYWPGLQNGADRDAVNELLSGDLARSRNLYERYGYGIYWVGKGLGAAAQLMNVALAEGRTGAARSLQRQIEEKLESWFSGTHSTHFMYYAPLGTVVGLPGEFGSITQMNDHHFDYGYWITAAANVALHDPAWARRSRWGGMVDELVDDIAYDHRGSQRFPYLRNFDVYAGHSWASGTEELQYGNNQESSSEAVNAWAGLIMWGAATGNTKLRNLGICLYTNEIHAIDTYWFDLHHQVLAPDYDGQYASQVFGGKYDDNTWWTEEPRQRLGINALPLTPASTYLGQDPAYVESLFAALPAQESLYAHRGGYEHVTRHIWNDILAEFLALSNPHAGFALWRTGGPVEAGETRSHTMFWLLSLKEMGRPDFRVTADTPFYAVFRGKNGQRTYLAYDAGGKPISVKFSDGTVLAVAAHSIARIH